MSYLSDVVCALLHRSGDWTLPSMNYLSHVVCKLLHKSGALFYAYPNMVAD